MKSSNLKEKIKSLPLTPGIYIYRDIEGVVIYVGKAKRLRNRVISYFRGTLDKRTKTYALVQNIHDLETINTNSEFEALILEAELIQKYQPKYNIVLKDDKSYLYIVIRDDMPGLPTVLTARKTQLLDKDTVFGPFTSSSTTKYVVKALRKMFPFRDCSKSKFTKYQKQGTPCLYGHLGLCPAPCVNTYLNTHDYRKNISSIKRTLKGNTSSLLNDIEKSMVQASKNEDFEVAAHLRDILKNFEYIRRDFHSAQEYIENPYLLEDLEREYLDSLVQLLPNLKSIPQRIECYDISNISGKEAVGSMVVAIDGKIDNREYRKFKIKTKDTPDDFAMMAEVLRRRLSREGDTNGKHWGTPDLIVLDGGKGQLSAVMPVLLDLNLDIPLVGLAKKFETIVYHDGLDYVELRYPKESPGLNLLIRLRDESHRFAQKYHHELRIKSIRL